MVNYNSKNLFPSYKIKHLFLDQQSSSESKLYLNGNEITINNSLYISLLDTIDYIRNSSFYLFVDKKVSVGEIKKLKIELSKAMQYRLTYITSNKNGELYGTSTGIPRIEFDYPDTIDMSLYPPPPRKVENLEVEESVVLEYDQNQIFVDNKIATFDTFREILETKLEQKEQPVLYLYISDNTEFEKYIKLLIDTKNIYYSVRNKYSSDKYGIPDHTELDYETIDSVRSIFPMIISEIEIEELSKIKEITW